MTDDEFLAAFEGRGLERRDWTHEAHVRMAWLYLTRSASYRAARDRVRDGIKKLNDSFTARPPQSCSTSSPTPAPSNPKLAGYHETVTTAFVRLIATRLRAGEDFAGFRARNADLFDRTLSALLRHYSPGRLFSDEATKEFVRPDLEPLPTL